MQHDNGGEVSLSIDAKGVTIAVDFARDNVLTGGGSDRSYHVTMMCCLFEGFGL
jgi:hypothetical protein